VQSRVASPHMHRRVRQWGEAAQIWAERGAEPRRRLKEQEVEQVWQHCRGQPVRGESVALQLVAHMWVAQEGTRDGDRVGLHHHKWPHKGGFKRRHRKLSHPSPDLLRIITFAQYPCLQKGAAKCVREGALRRRRGLEEGRVNPRAHVVAGRKPDDRRAVG
jgi:hypothetical protein